MITLTPFEHVLRRALVDRIGASASPDPREHCLSYRRLGLLVDPDDRSRYPMTRPPFRGLNEALGHVSMYEAERGRPMLTAIVVNEETGHPGSGFARLGRHLGFDVDDEDGFWRAELDAAVRFWKTDDVVLVVDAAVEVLMAELGSIRQLVRKMAAR